MSDQEVLESLNLPSSMYLVDSSDISDLLLEYDAVCQECDALCLQIDDEKTPYKSKYAARDWREMSRALRHANLLTSVLVLLYQ